MNSDMEYKRLCDVGCGKRPKEGWIGLDIMPLEGIVRYDMTQESLPYADNSIDAIRVINTMEHIERKYWIKIFNGWWKKLKKGGTLEIVVPNGKKDIEHVWGDITHQSVWVPMTFRYLSGERPRHAVYPIYHWTILELKDLPEEPRDLYALLTPQIDTKTGEKYGLKCSYESF